MVYVLLALIIMLTPVIGSYLYFHYKTGVPTFPTMPPMRRKMIENLKADYKARYSKNYTIIDLGSGSGQLTTHIAREIPGAHVVGIELSWIPYLRSVFRQRLFGPNNLEFRRVDFWSTNVSQADAVITYLMEPIMERMSEKLRNELKPGALIIASKFALSGAWKPFKTFDIQFPLKMQLRLYRQYSAANINEEDDVLFGDIEDRAAGTALAQANE